MSKIAVVVGVLVVGGVAAAGYVYVKSKTPDLGPAGPNAQLAPESLSVYAEVPDLRGTWTTLEAHPSWRDFVASSAADGVMASPVVQDFLAAVEHVATKAKYRVDSKNAMKFFGRECSVGVQLDPAGGPAKVLLLTKLDTDAVAKDLLDGKTDLDALWAELQKRTTQCDVAVTAYEHEGQSIATATRGASTFHAALLGDTLAVATDKTLLHASIACRKSGGERSLARKAAFASDMKALPAGTAVREWYDLAAMDGARTSLDGTLGSLGAQPGAVTAVHAVLDASRGAGSVARATQIPGGDLYQATWTYSKDADLFADKASPALRELYTGPWLLYAEAHDIGGLVTAWKGSALRRNLGQSEFGKWLDKTMNDPTPVLQKAASFATSPVVRARAGRGARDPSAAVDEAIEQVDRFALRMGKHMAEDLAGKVLAGDASLGVEWSGDPETLPVVAGAVRLGIDGRLLALAAWAAMADDPTSGVKSEPCGTRLLYTSSNDPPVHWAMVGDTVVASNDREFVTRAASGDGNPANASPALRDAVAQLKPGWRFFCTMDLERTLAAVEKLLPSGGGGRRGRGGQPDVAGFIEIYRELGAVGRQLTLAAYVPDDFSRFEMRGAMNYFDAKTDAGRTLREHAREMREPLCWSFLPESTLFHTAQTANGVEAFWGGMKAGMGVAGLQQQDVEQAFREAMDMELEGELIPALGREIVFAVTHRAAASGSPNEIVIPGVVLGIEAKDPAVVRKAVDRALELLGQSAAKEQDENPIVRETRNGVELVRIVLPPEAGVPLEPSIAIHDDFLIVATDPDTLRSCLDARAGKGGRMRDAAGFAAATQSTAATCAAYSYVDWNRVVDQVQVYAPQIGQMTGSPDVPFPEYPEEDSDAARAEYERQVEEFQKKMEEARNSGGDNAKKWIESLRVVDWIASSGTSDGLRMEFATVVKFKD